MPDLPAIVKYQSTVTYLAEKLVSRLDEMGCAFCDDEVKDLIVDIQKAKQEFHSS